MKCGGMIIEVKIHSLTKVKHREENANFQKLVRIEEDAIHCRGRWKYANKLGKSQSCFHVKKYPKKAILKDISFMKGFGN